MIVQDSPAPHTSVIEEAKARVETIQLADVLTGPAKMRKVGAEWVARCPLPGHEDRTPSFTVNEAKNLWFCHGCLRGGDVVTLAQRAWQIDRPDVAAAEVLVYFGYEIPPRPSAWFAKQERQAPVREAIERAKIQHYQRRVFRRIFASHLREIPDEAERIVEAEILWEAAGEIAAMILAARMPGDAGRRAA